MSNVELGELIDVVKARLVVICSGPLAETIACSIVGELQSRYKIEPLENTVEEEATK